MVTFEAIIEKFGINGERTGWFHVIIPSEIAHQLMPNTKKSIRVKGNIGAFEAKYLALLPSGTGDFILPLNAKMREIIKLNEGDKIILNLELDLDVPPLSIDLLEALEIETGAFDYFNTLNKSTQRYFSNWIDDAKTIETKSKRIYQAVYGLSINLDFGKTLRYFKNKD